MRTFNRLLVPPLISLCAACSEPVEPTALPPFGTLNVAVTTSGRDLPLSLNVYTSSASRKIAPVANVTFERIPPGMTTVWLSGLPLNCRLHEANPQKVDIPAGGSVSVSFTVECHPRLGSLQIITRTGGTDVAAASYRVHVQSNTALRDVLHYHTLAVPSNGSTWLSNVAAGASTVTLQEVHANCDVTNTNRRMIELRGGDTASVSYDVVCAPATRLAYASEFGGIYTIDSNGRNRVQLTAGPHQDPAWSPDGSRIAFTSYGQGPGEIYVVNADGTNLTRLTHHAASDYQPAWSPDGKSIAFVSERDDNSEVYVVNVDGSNLVRLTNDSQPDLHPAWSPSGAEIAISRGVPDRAQIYAISTDGSARIRQLTTEGGWQPAWSPDGKRIAFTSRYCPGYPYGCSSAVFVKDEDSSPRMLVAGEDPSWSPDGRHIAFIAFECDYYVTRCQPSGVRIARVDGTDVVDLASGAFTPSWRR